MTTEKMVQRWDIQVVMAAVPYDDAAFGFMTKDEAAEWLYRTAFEVMAGLPLKGKVIQMRVTAISKDEKDAAKVPKASPGAGESGGESPGPSPIPRP